MNEKLNQLKEYLLSQGSMANGEKRLPGGTGGKAVSDRGDPGRGLGAADGGGQDGHLCSYRRKPREPCKNGSRGSRHPETPV